MRTDRAARVSCNRHLWVRLNLCLRLVTRLECSLCALKSIDSVQWDDGMVEVLARRERPQLVFDDAGRPIALVTGSARSAPPPAMSAHRNPTPDFRVRVGGGDGSPSVDPSDRSFTLITPVLVR